MGEHDINPSCENIHAEMRKFKDDLENPKDGVIRCIYKHIATKVSMRVFLSLIGLLVAITLGGMKYSYSQGEEHEDLATKAELLKLEADTSKEIHDHVEDIKADVNKIEGDVDKILAMQQTILLEVRKK